MNWGENKTKRCGYRFGEIGRSGVSAGNYVLYIDSQGKAVYEADVRRQVDKGWRGFWRRRGLADVPKVSREFLGEFSLPEGRAA